MLSEQEEKAAKTPGGKPILSQKEYVPTPYRDSSWEVVGERVKERHFMPLELSIIRTPQAAADPMFEEFGASFDPSIDRIRHASGMEMFASEDEINATKKKIDEEMLKASVIQARKEGYEEGYTAGEEAAKLVIAEHYEIIQQRVANISKDIKNHMGSLIAKMEQSALELALTISRKILSTTVELKPDYILDVIRNSLSAAGAGKPLRVRLSPQDLEFLTVVGFPEELSSEETGIVYVADEAVKAGCVVESDFGEIDLQIDRMWEQVKENLYGATK